MHVANILRTAEAIEASDHFIMADWDECIAGHAFDLAGKDYPAITRFLNFIIGWNGHRVAKSKSYIARRFLGITEGQAKGLFLGNPAFYPYLAPDVAHATPAQAAKVLRILAITGEVDWSAALDDNEPELPAVPAKTATEPQTV